ncbi:MAG: GNAT family N-acetyltransferase [Leptolyngbya sp. SIO4C1]|nr:GNAT family N-acetyltransferase [Leptolyngbya sp. SIO4C1]
MTQQEAKRSVKRAVPLSIRLFQAEDAAIGEAILRSLLAWFGIESAIVQYCRDLTEMETYLAEAEGQAVGFVTLNQHNPYTAEIHLIAVLATWHRSGVGSALVRYAEQVLRSRSIEYLEVKTLGPSKPDANYARTRQFYEVMGFRPLEENGLWGEVNPCLIMVKHLSCGNHTD